MYNKEEIIKSIEQLIEEKKREHKTEEVAELEILRDKLRQVQNDEQLFKWLDLAVKFLTAAATVIHFIK